MKQRKPLTRSTPMRRTEMPRGSKPLTRGPVKKRRCDAGPTAAVRLMVRARAQDRCENCSASGMDVHHRRPRALGGSSDPATNRASNLVLLCRECHSWFESHRTRALADGWLVPQGTDPAAVPVLRGGRWVLLDDEGGWAEVGEAA